MMDKVGQFAGLGLICLFASATSIIAPGTPNPIYPAGPLMTLMNSTENGKLYHIQGSNNVNLRVVHVWGSPSEMGEAQGLLLGGFIHEFITDALPQFYNVRMHAD